MKKLLEQYFKNLFETSARGDAREESYYQHLDALIKQYADFTKIKNIDVTIVPKKTEAGNPDFRIWDGANHVTGYIEAKDPLNTNLDTIENSEQLKRYRSTFPNVILTNFYEFRLYRDGERVAQAMIGRPVIANKLNTTPPVENIDKFKELLEFFFSFSLPVVQTAYSLALELAKRTRFLRDEIIAVELAENGSKGQKQIIGFFDAFKKYLLATITAKQFADLYAQTITYGLFAARSRVPQGSAEFNRRLAVNYIPQTIGILRDVFEFISLGQPPKSLQIIVDDISEILKIADVDKILHEYHTTGKGSDPIIHFYETFLATYDPEIRERRGVYYTPEPVVGYIVRSIHSLLKSHFNLADGLASEEVKLLDPAGGTLTFPAEAIRVAAEEFTQKYGAGALHPWVKKHILANFHAFELMMAPYAIGHLKIGFILNELGYKMSDDERFKLYLTNTLEMEEIEQIFIPGLSSLSEESHLAAKVKKDQPVLVILGNPPYSGNSANVNEWTERLLKEDMDGCQSYYKADGKSLGERNPKWLQDDYVKFLRFAQWKIQKAGYGIVGMITNHSYLDNPTFRGMRQSLMKTFDEIYIIDLHGNSLKKETTPDGGKDENVFQIRQGVAIALYVKNKPAKKTSVYHTDLYGIRKEKFNWLNNNKLTVKNYTKIQPRSPYYFFIRRKTEQIQHYLKWKKINEIFPVNGVGITTARDNFVIDFDRSSVENRIRRFKNSKYDDKTLHEFFQIPKKKGWDIRKAWNMLQPLSDSELHELIQTISYRPFDNRYIFWHDSVVWRTVKRIMQHMLKRNIGLVTSRQAQSGFKHVFISENMIEFNVTGIAGRYGSGYLFPLYLYPEDKKNMPRSAGTLMMVFDETETYGKQPNVAPFIFEKLAGAFGEKPSPEDVFYYIYGVFYSAVYREKYGEFLKIDFPRVPFTSDYTLFKKIGDLGKKLADLHLLKATAIDTPIAKCPVVGSENRIEKIRYNQDEQRIYFNKDKYFDGVAPEVWNYHIGGYQVLHKYLKDRKGREMDEASQYCRIVTALSKTITIQQQIDDIYPETELNLLNF